MGAAASAVTGVIAGATTGAAAAAAAMGEAVGATGAEASSISAPDGSAHSSATLGDSAVGGVVARAADGVWLIAAAADSELWLSRFLEFSAEGSVAYQ